MAVSRIIVSIAAKLLIAAGEALIKAAQKLPKGQGTRNGPGDNVH